MKAINSMPSIVVKDLGKAYKQYPTRWSRLAEWLTPGQKPRHALKWVLQDINFTVNAGEAVGIVGVNGAGKSTLLKMITGTTQPTTGSVQINGRVAALLELGMGFHPDFTGRQNAYMAGQLLGYSVEEIAELMPEIEAFADIGDYIEQPVRVYSSGMQVRLAFAVATARRPDVLIIDEALSVGDAAFQRKCFRRIESYRLEGATLLFVSHDIETIKRLCDRAIFISRGEIFSIGKAKDVCDAYEQSIFGKSSKSQSIAEPNKTLDLLDSALVSSSIEKQYGDGSAEIYDIYLKGVDNSPINVIHEGNPFIVNYKVRFKECSSGVMFGMMIKTVDGICVYGTNTERQDLKDSFNQGDCVSIKFELQGNLVPGNYYLNVGATRLGDETIEFMHRRVDSLIFRVVTAHTHVSMGYANMFALSSIDSNDVAQMKVVKE